MKKSLTILCIAALASSQFAACHKNVDGPQENKDTKQEVKVVLPYDLEVIDLDHTLPLTEIDVEWNAAEGVSYEFVASLKEDMSNPASEKLSGKGKAVLTHKQLDDLAGRLGVPAYKMAELYWVIRDSQGNQSKYRIMNIGRFLTPFTDPRDNETYRVTRVVDKLSGNYWVWMADNMRATKYSDGTAMNPAKDYVFMEAEATDSDHIKEWKRLRGAYYTWTATVRDVAAAEAGDKVQGIAPNGWHIATKDEWIQLINMQEDNTKPGTSMKDPLYWPETASDKANNNSGLNIVATGYVPNVTHTTRKFVEIDQNTYFWHSTTPKDGDVIPWNPDPATFPNKAYTYALRANDAGTALYVYDRTRGYNVRCVLD